MPRLMKWTGCHYAAGYEVRAALCAVGQFKLRFGRRGSGVVGALFRFLLCRWFLIYLYTYVVIVNKAPGFLWISAKTPYESGLCEAHNRNRRV